MIFITIEQLNYFLSLCKHKNFSTASDELYISQSSLSKHIKFLEKELNTVLFNRNTRSISLTPSGEEFYIYAKNAVNEYNTLLINLRKYNNNHIVLNISAIPVTAQYKITSAIAKFKDIYPYIDINIVEDNNYNILNKLIQSEVDFGIIRDFNLSSEMFNKIPLIDDELVVALSKDHPLSKKTSLSLFDIKNEKFILLEPNSGIYERCINEFNKHSLSINIVSTFNKIETILGLVSENLGITLLMKNVLNSFNKDNIVTIKMVPPIRANLSLITLKGKELSSSELLFTNFLRNFIKNALANN